MNLLKGHVNVLNRLTQAPNGHFVVVASIDPVRGLRFGLARRLLGTVTGEDILPPELARRLDKKPKAAYRWETGEDRPRADTVKQLAEMCQEAGLPITAGWLERGETELPAISIPASALEPKVAVTSVPRHVTPLKKKSKTTPRPSQAAQAKKTAGIK
jgi:transcriptional regulator with XRE-family HTH domain